jgi:hypothetical protein
MGYGRLSIVSGKEAEGGNEGEKQMVSFEEAGKAHMVQCL